MKVRTFYIHDMSMISSCRHTGVVVYGKEFFYGGMGIEFCGPVSVVIMVE